MRNRILISTIVCSLLISCEKESISDKSSGYLNSVTLDIDVKCIAADGNETVKFTVIDGGGVDVSEDSSIWLLSDDGNRELDAGAFSTDIPGQYEFQAVYCAIHSNVVTVTAVAVEEESEFEKLELVADKTEIAANDADVVTFTVFGDGEDVTDVPGISVCMESGMCMVARDGKFTWSTDTPGEYVFTAGFGDLHSAPVTVTAR